MSTRGVTTSSLEIVNPLYSACTWVRTYNSRRELKIRQNTVQMDSTNVHRRRKLSTLKIKSNLCSDAFSRASLFLNFLSYSRQWYKLIARLSSTPFQRCSFH